MIEVESYYPHIVRCLNSLGVSRELIEDYSQDVAIKLLLTSPKHTTNIKGWIWKIIRNYVVSESRKRKLDYNLCTSCESKDYNLIDKVLALHNILFTGDMLVVGRCYIEGKSIAETIKETGMPYNTIRTYRMRWRTRIRNAFKEYDF